ncbi:MAG: cysteine desulfurase [Candidatus Odinarchaeum yellowstonii]|uniref:cysteine desulfurase n=1 Tax=Odinarchaeota yellowstonii (strain LCB_4) TaxID=1841599 RepID=A0AAF0D3B7_ODILC|nr:MAG: cysteine desulfurase [Candidatus Odinarchaeum yellowstonii]
MNSNNGYLTVEQVRADIPLTKDYIYFDNAATTPVPVPVIRKMEEYLREYCANIERGAYSIANRVTEEWDQARSDVARILLKCDPKNLIFTRNLTQATNIVAYALANPPLTVKNNRLISKRPLINWRRGDEIVTTIVEHHSNILPWMRLAYYKRAVFKMIKNLPKTGLITVESVLQNITSKTRVLAFQHASNVFGTVNDVKSIIKAVKEVNPDCLIYVDGSQGPGHMPVEVEDLGCDFYGFSGHKGPLGPSGTGGLYVKKEIIEELEPIEIGGGVIVNVAEDYYELRRDYPSKKFDAGSPNILGLIGLGEASRYIYRIGLKRIHERERRLTEYLLSELSKIKGLEIYGPMESEYKTGVVTFNLKGWSSHDLSLALDEKWKILTRAGYHCAMPAIRWLGVDEVHKGNVRISFHYYNTFEEVDTAIEALKQLAS